jgi:hypothetical protein
MIFDHVSQHGLGPAQVPDRAFFACELVYESFLKSLDNRATRKMVHGGGHKRRPAFSQQPCFTGFPEK